MLHKKQKEFHDAFHPPAIFHSSSSATENDRSAPNRQRHGYVSIEAKIGVCHTWISIEMGLVETHFTLAVVDSAWICWNYRILVILGFNWYFGGDGINTFIVKLILILLFWLDFGEKEKKIAELWLCWMGGVMEDEGKKLTTDLRRWGRWKFVFTKISGVLLKLLKLLNITFL